MMRSAERMQNAMAKALKRITWEFNCCLILWLDRSPQQRTHCQKTGVVTIEITVPLATAALLLAQLQTFPLDET